MINPPLVSRALIQKMLYAGSQEALEELVSHNPDLQTYHQIAWPMHEALNMLLTADQNNPAGYAETSVEEIRPFRPGISVVLSRQNDGKKMADLFEFSVDVLKQVAKKAPPELVFYGFLTLQISQHAPAYLTDESYWMLDIMVAQETEPELVRKLERYRDVLEVCLSLGFDWAWMEGILSSL